MLSTPFEWVRFYRSKGLTVLKVARGTKGCLIDGWNRLPPEELEKMITEEDNIGIRLDDLSVLDFERPELVEALFTEGVNVLSAHTWVAKTGRGFHIYMRGLPSGKKIVKADGLVEFRSGSDLLPGFAMSGLRTWRGLGLRKLALRPLRGCGKKSKSYRFSRGLSRALRRHG
jgi:hypothetical protein